MKTCIKCGVEKDAAEFHISQTNKDGRRGICASCDNATQRDWRKNNLDTKRITVGKYSKDNPAKIILIRSRGNAKKHGWAPPNITEQDLTAMLSTRGKCSFPDCKNDGKDLDHDHVTGVVRGWLCRQHNMLLGLAHDSTKDLEFAIIYLNKTARKRHEDAVVISNIKDL